MMLTFVNTISKLVINVFSPASNTAKMGMLAGSQIRIL
jgi:hypothetical protein